MNFSKIHPFIRFIHYLPLTPEDQYSFTTPYDNRLFYVHAGTEKIAAAGRIYTLSEGDMLIIPSGTEYRLLSPEAPVTLIGVNFDYTQNHIDKQKPIPPIDPADFTPDQQLETLSFRDFDEFNGVVYLSGMQSAAERLLTMEREYTAKFLCYEQIISGLFTEVLVECLRTLRRQKFCGNAGLILSIIAYINEYYYKPLTNRSIAKNFNLHPNYVSALVKKHTGMPLHRYVLHAKISHSITMLNRTGHDIGTIAQKCGFYDIYHFSKVFKKIVGVAPSRYVLTGETAGVHTRKT